MNSALGLTQEISENMKFFPKEVNFLNASKAKKLNQEIYLYCMPRGEPRETSAVELQNLLNKFVGAYLLSVMICQSSLSVTCKKFPLRYAEVALMRSCFRRVRS